jgi:hypothetical protein
MQKTKAMILIGFIAFFLFACSSIPSGKERAYSAIQKAELQGWKPLEIDAGDFKLFALLPNIQPTSQILNVFIEGDGLAWLSRSQPSFDPTPINPVSLNLALQFPTNTAIAYLARPCQYFINKNANCSQKYWTSHRFSADIIQTQSLALDKLKMLTGASKLRLFGYSGGGAIASLLAADRNDVIELITIAGNLDHQAWTAYHGLSPLFGSLNPIDVKNRIAHIPQHHFIGENDRVIPAEVVKYFIENAPSTTQVKIFSGANHHCCWENALNDFISDN